MEIPEEPSDRVLATAWASALAVLDVLRRLEDGEITREEAVGVLEIIVGAAHLELMGEIAVAAGWKREAGWGNS